MAERKKKYGGLSDMFNLQICPVCGKDYIIQHTADWAYQKQIGTKHLYYCSWGCMRKHLRELGRI